MAEPLNWRKTAAVGGRWRGSSREETDLGAPGGNQGWMEEPVAGGGGWGG